MRRLLLLLRWLVAKIRNVFEFRGRRSVDWHGAELARAVENERQDTPQQEVPTTEPYHPMSQVGRQPLPVAGLTCPLGEQREAEARQTSEPCLPDAAGPCHASPIQEAANAYAPQRQLSGLATEAHEPEQAELGETSAILAPAGSEQPTDSADLRDRVGDACMPQSPDADRPTTEGLALVGTSPPPVASDEVPPSQPRIAHSAASPTGPAELSSADTCTLPHQSRPDTPLASVLTDRLHSTAVDDRPEAHDASGDAHARLPNTASPSPRRMPDIAADGGAQAVAPAGSRVPVASRTPPRNTVPPEKRGGRPRVAEPAANPPSEMSDGAGRESDSAALPELVCWRTGMRWQVGIEVGATDSQNPWRLIEHGQPQTPDAMNRWCLHSPLAGAELRHHATQETHCFAAERYRIFWLTGPSYDQGRRQNRIGQGHFLVVTPLDWTLQDRFAALQTQQPEAVFGGKYRAHLLDTTDGVPAELVFDTPTGSMPIPATAPAFELRGKRLHINTSSFATPVFTEEPPELCALGSSTYCKVVVGDEGKPHYEKRRHHASEFEALRPWIARLRVGWFYVRLYDDHDELIESHDFIFVADLREIQVLSHRVLPHVTGHEPVEVTFAHTSQLQIIHIPGGDNRSLTIAHSGTRSVVSIPADLAYEETQWLLRDNRYWRYVQVPLYLGRLWWCVTDEQAQPADMHWQDKPLQLHVDDFRATSMRVLRLRVPRGIRADDLRMGLDLERSLQPRPTAGLPYHYELPCRELERYPELDDASTYAEIKCWVRGAPSQEEAGCVVVATKGMRARDFECQQSDGGPNTEIKMSWKEDGSAPRKRLRLWREGVRDRSAYEQDLPAETTQASIVAPALTPGDYLVEVTPIEESASSARYPDPSTHPNTCPITIESECNLRIGQSFRITRVCCEGGRKLRLKLKYRVTIQGRIINRQLPKDVARGHVHVKKINDGWYVGTLRIAGGKNRGETGAALTIDDLNPMKIELTADHQYVTAIEDRGGDGAVYCEMCRQLFWRGMELHSEHRCGELLGPNGLQFVVRWAEQQASGNG